jgi:hypothetical protein
MDHGLDRRSFLGLAALGVVGMRRAGSLTAASAASAGELTYEKFLAEAAPLARELVKDVSRTGEDRYLLALAAHAVRLRDVPVPEMRDNTFDKASKARTWIGANEGSADGLDPFVVLHWKLDPGGVIAQHPHLYGNVVTLCLEGDLRVRNYEMVEEPDFVRAEPFEVRRVNDQVLRAGDVNFVPLTHAYTHGFVAGEKGARGLDITTRTREWQKTPSLVLSDEPIDEELGLYEGKWVYR